MKSFTVSPVRSAILYFWRALLQWLLFPVVVLWALVVLFIRLLLADAYGMVTLLYTERRSNGEGRLERRATHLKQRLS